jgi:hypothetical protein
MAKCQARRCPAVGATCFQCFKTGHLGWVCNQRKARQAAKSSQRQQGNGRGNNKGFAPPRGTNECEIAGAGYAERQEYHQFQATAGDQGQAGNGQYAEQNAVGYFPVYQPVDEQSTYQSVQANQLGFLQDLARRASSSPTVQPTRKTSGHSVQEVHVQFKASSIDEMKVSATLFQTYKKWVHDVWIKHAVMNRRPSTSENRYGCLR